MTWVLLVLAACQTDDEALKGKADASTGGSGGAACEFDDWRTSMAGAVHHDPVVPEPGTWCPREGIELCTDRAPGTLPYDPALASDAGPSDPPGVLSRCVQSVWQTVAGATCEGTRENCNVFNSRDYDGECCSHLRNCELAFCDGERWWTRR